LNHILQAPHRVYFYQIVICTQGVGTHLIDFVESAYDEETLLLVSKGQVHQFQVNPANQGFLILFTSEFLYENATEINLSHSLRVFEQALFSPAIRPLPDQQQSLKTLCQMMYHEYHAPPDKLSTEVLRHLLRLILLQIERAQQINPSSQQAAPYYQEFVAFRRLVERDLGRSRNVQYYARQLAISAKKLNELARQVVNKTAKNFIDEQVVLEAQRLLAQGDMPIKEIAYHLGFSEPTNLGKFFKKHTHMTPLAFRQQFHPSD
ncbi:MAG: AraC family transcriptional regulator, partial [Anaerolineales bacterium]|nr:AraC family transcriptional regulator [Anaerolineales bacterium]